MYNLEATPAEGTTYRFARRTASATPASCRRGPRSALLHQLVPTAGRVHRRPVRGARRQEPLQHKYTGGTVLHLYMNERISSPRSLQETGATSTRRFGLPYITITPTFSICPKHGYVEGEHPFCPKCDVELLAKNGASWSLHEGPHSPHGKHESSSLSVLERENERYDRYRMPQPCTDRRRAPAL